MLGSPSKVCLWLSSRPIPKDTKLLEAVEALTAWAQERPRNWHPEIPRGARCFVFRADTESTCERGRRARRRRFSGGSGQAEPPLDRLLIATNIAMGQTLESTLADLTFRALLNLFCTPCRSLGSAMG
eukprot:15368181-Alexandrium_andersonii.AAC.1